MSRDNKNIIYSARDIEQYLTGKLSPLQMHAMEKAALLMDSVHDGVGLGRVQVGFEAPASGRAAGEYLLASGFRDARIMVSDLIRHPLAYIGILVFTRLLTHNPLTLTDGPLSVRRALTLGEWKDLFNRAEVAPFDLRHLFPFRIFALFELGK